MLALGRLDTKSLFLIVLGVNHSFILFSSFIILFGLGMGNGSREEKSHFLLVVSNWCLYNKELMFECMDALAF
jgi:hypothetical protein